MIGVSILEKGTTNACITNIDGDYFLNVKNTGKLMERDRTASFNDKINAWELAKGEYKWMVAASFADIRCIVTQKVAKARKDKANDAMKLLLS